MLARVYKAKAVEEGLDKEDSFEPMYELQKEYYQQHVFFRMHIDEYWPPSDEAQKAYYEENKDKYRQTETFKFRHIFFKVVDEPEAVQKKARERAEDALKRLQAGESFDDVSTAFSDSQKKRRGGRPLPPGADQSTDRKGSACARKRRTQRPSLKQSTAMRFSCWKTTFRRMSSHSSR